MPRKDKNFIAAIWHALFGLSISLGLCLLIQLLELCLAKSVYARSVVFAWAEVRFFFIHLTLNGLANKSSVQNAEDTPFSFV